MYSFKTSLLCMTTNHRAQLCGPAPLKISAFLRALVPAPFSSISFTCAFLNPTSLSADAAADTGLELGSVAQDRALAAGEWVAFHPHSLLFISHSSFIYCCFRIEWHRDYEKYDFPTGKKAELKRTGQRVVVSWQWGDPLNVLQIGQLWDCGSWTLKLHWAL